MNENIDLTKILEGCPRGTKFYSSVYGEVTFARIRFNNDYPIELKYYPKGANLFGATVHLTRDGRTHICCDGECILFPSKEQRDWSKFVRFWQLWDIPKIEEFDAKTLHYFDKVLVRDDNESTWEQAYFGCMDDDTYVMCIADRPFFEPWKQCIPYNEETNHLIGTKEDCPDFYKWWEE